MYRAFRDLKIWRENLRHLAQLQRTADKKEAARSGCCSVLQCVAVCCSVLQCVAVCCSALQCVAVRLLQCVAAFCSAAVAVCCSMLQCAAVSTCC